MIENQNKELTVQELLDMGVCEYRDWSMKNAINIINDIKDIDKINNIDLRRCKLISIPQCLKEFKNLTNLYLTDNKITKIENLDNLIYLNSLILMNNKITKIEGLDNCVNLTKLDLSYNQIIKIENLDNLKNLEHLDLAKNNIEILEGLNKNKKLRTLNLNINPLKYSRHKYKVFEKKSTKIFFNKTDNIENVINKLYAKYYEDKNKNFKISNNTKEEKSNNNILKEKILTENKQEVQDIDNKIQGLNFVIENSLKEIEKLQKEKTKLISEENITILY